ncbi:hypothetical protein [Kribbella lupini]|uniref:Ribosomally synthesized peptide with SipW-like signal peptide n=1 Tax=Kribbella lupini TaxID=291602 RepID=A0ABP4MY78_9ACTN
MNTDELRTLLKEAGRPVSSPGDPVPVIRRRARRHRRNQAAAAVACTAVVVAGVASAVDLWPRDSVGPAGSVATQFPLQALDDTPLEVGTRKLLDDPAPHRELEAGGGLYLGMDGLRPDDLVRVRMVCPTASGSAPVTLEVSLRPFTEQQLDPPPTPPGGAVPGARQVACTDTISSADFVVPAGWPRYAVAQVDMKPNEIRSLKLEVAAYR